jgi:hypothetical protein
MLLFEWASRFETVGYKLAEGKGLREGWNSKELWKSVEKFGPREINSWQLKAKTHEQSRQENQEF